MTRDLTTDLNENLRRTIDKLAEAATLGDSRQFGPVTASSAGVPVPLFNRVFVFDDPPPDDLSAAVGWMAERDVPFWVTVTDTVVEGITNHLADLDLVKAGEEPCMAMATLDEVPPRDSVVDISEVSAPDEVEDCSTVSAPAAFATPKDVEPIGQAALVADDMRVFLGRVDGHPAASGLLAQSGDVAGVYGIAVVEEFRRQGIGEAMTWEVLRAGREAGCRVGVLQSSEMAYSLYKKMGFETLVTNHLFVPAD